MSTGTGGRKRPCTARQNAVVTKVVRHHVRQRWSVRTLTPSHACRRWARAGVIPACSAVTKTTTAPRYTRRPR